MASINITGSTNISMKKEPPYICEYCNRDYKILENYKKHYNVCEFFNKTRKERCQEREEFEILPSQKDMFRIIQDLANRCVRLETEVRHLKTTIASRKRKEVVEYLNQIASPPMTFRQWIEGQTIQMHHLECVFETNLTEGLKLCIKEYLQETHSKETKDMNSLLKSTQIPICAFEQRQNVFYIYDSSGSSSPVWKRMEPEIFDRWISTLSHRFLQYFVEWQSDNLSKLTTEQDTVDNIMYMIKVNGGRNPTTIDKERRCNELKKWLFSNIHISAGTMVELIV